MGHELASREVNVQADPAAKPASRPTLRVGAAADPAEAAADRMANEVVVSLRRSMTSVVPEAGVPGVTGSLPSRTRIRRSSGTPAGAHASAAGGAVPAELDQRIQAARRGGDPMPGVVRRRMEHAFGADFGQVRIHSGAEAGHISRALGASAFTVGSDVFMPGGVGSADTATEHTLAHELTHVVQHGATSTIHRKFGFEFELQIPVFRRGPTGNPAPPTRSGAVQLAEGDGFDVHSDHSSRVNMAVPPTAREHPGAGAPPTATILEVATHPLDERAVSEADVRQAIEKVRAFAESAARRAKRQNTAGNDWQRQLYSASTLLDNVRHVVNATPAGTNYLGPGFTNANIPAAAKLGVIHANAYAQATHGVSLKSIPDYFSAQASDESAIAAKYKTALTNAVRIGSEMTAWLATEKTKAGKLENNVRRELTGFFSAIAYYLLAGAAVSAGEAAPGTLGKNLIGPYFLKTGLHTVRNQLKEKYKDAASLLAGRKQASLKRKMLALTGRQAGHNFFPTRNGDFTCGSWLAGVLAGTSDLALGWKNPWSKELTEQSIGSGSEEGIGLVIESRRLADTLGQQNKRYRPDEWADLAVQVYWERLLLGGTAQQRLEAAQALGLTRAAAAGGGPGGGPPPPPPPGGGPPPPPPPPPGHV